MNTKVFQSVKRACYAGLDSVTLRAEVAERMPPTMARAYAERLYPLHSAPHIIKRARQGRTVVRAGEESPEVVAEQRAHGFRYRTHVFLANAGRVWGKWCLLREDAPERELQREQHLLRELVPHITHGLQRAALLETAFRDDTGDEASRAGIIVIDARRRVIVRTPSAQRALVDLADVGIVDPDALPLSVYTCAERARKELRRRDPKDSETVSLRARGRSGCWYVV